MAMYVVSLKAVDNSHSASSSAAQTYSGYRKDTSTAWLFLPTSYEASIVACGRGS